MKLLLGIMLMGIMVTTPTPTIAGSIPLTDSQKLLRTAVRAFVQDPGNEDIADIIHTLTENILDEYYSDGTGSGMINELNKLVMENNQIQQSVDDLDELRDVIETLPPEE